MWTPAWEVKFRAEARYEDTYHIDTGYEKYVVKIEHSEGYDGPDDWDNFGTLVIWHRRYSFGVNGLKKYGSSSAFLEEFNDTNSVMISVAMLDHSGITLYEGTRAHPQDSGGWDSGQLGWMYATKDEICVNWGVKSWHNKVKHSNGKMIKAKDYAYELLRSELKTWDDYVTGNVHDYNIDDSQGDNVDSCCGFYGDIDESGILDNITDAIKEDTKKTLGKYKHQLNKLKAVIRNKVPIIYRKPFKY